MKTRNLYKRVLSMMLVCVMIAACVPQAAFAGEQPKTETSAEKPAEDKPADTEAPKAAEEKPAQEKPAEEKPAADKPADTEAPKPAEEKPAEEKPAADKPADTEAPKPAEEKPAADKPADTEASKPAEEKPAADKPADDAGKPAADADAAGKSDAEQPADAADKKESTEEKPAESEGETQEEKAAYPAQSFSGSSKELSVDARADAGVFPEGTTMVVKAATRKQLEQVIAEEDAVDAVAVDITFYDKAGREIQPANGSTVEITLTAKRPVEGDTHEAVTMDDHGNTETVADATAVESVFDAEHFTIYAIIGKDEEPALLTVNFYDQDGKLLSTQVVKNGDTLLEPEVPKEIDRKVFAGWYEDGAESPYTGFGTVSGVTKTATLDLKAKYSEEIVHVIYHDSLDYVIDSVEVPANSSVEVLSNSPIVGTTKDAECHVGWAIEKGGTENVAGTMAVGTQDVNLYPIVKEGHWVTFDTDGGTSFNRQFIALDAEGDDKKAENPGDPYKEGYSFDGWYADETCTTAFDFTQDITDDVTVYAKWTENPDTYYVVEYYIEYQSDIASDTWDYKLVTAEVKTAPKGSDAAYDDNLIFSEPYSYTKSGYALNEDKTEKDVKVAADGSTVWKIYYKCNTYTITTIIPLEDGTTYTLTMDAKYTADLGYYWDEVAKHRNLNDLFDGVHRFKYGPNSLFVDSVNALRTMSVTYSLTNGRWESKPDRTLSYRFWCETLEGDAPEGKEALANHSARQLLGTITDNRTYYLADEGSIGDDLQLLTHGPYNEYPGFRVWLPYSDGNFLLYTNGWYIFFHAGTRYAGDIYGVTNEKGKNMWLFWHRCGDVNATEAYAA